MCAQGRESRLDAVPNSKSNEDCHSEPEQHSPQQSRLRKVFVFANPGQHGLIAVWSTVCSSERVGCPDWCALLVWLASGDQWDRLAKS